MKSIKMWGRYIKCSTGHIWTYFIFLKNWKIFQDFCAHFHTFIHVHEARPGITLPVNHLGLGPLGCATVYSFSAPCMQYRSLLQSSIHVTDFIWAIKYFYYSNLPRSFFHLSGIDSVLLRLDMVKGINYPHKQNHNIRIYIVIFDNKCF